MTSNLIVRDEEVGRPSVRRPRPMPRGNTRLVYLNSKGQLECPPSPLTAGGILFGGIKRVYEVDVAEHSTIVNLQAPSQEMAFFFDVEAHVTWHVTEPGEVVRRRIQDGDSLVTDYLKPRVVEVCRQYPIESEASAEAGARTALCGWVAQDGLGSRGTPSEHQIGGVLLATVTQLRVKLDAAASAHLRSRTEAERAKEKERLDSSVRINRTRTQSEELEINARFAARKEELEREMESQRVAHQIAMKQQRMDFFRAAIEQNSQGLILAYLGSHENEIGDVVRLLINYKQIGFKAASDILKVLTDAEMIDRADVDGLAKRVQDQVVDHFSGGPLAELPGQPTTERREAAWRPGDEPSAVTAEVLSEDTRGTHDDDDPDDYGPVD